MNEHLTFTYDSEATAGLLINKPAFRLHGYRFFLYQAAVNRPLNTGKKTIKSRRPDP